MSRDEVAQEPKNEASEWLAKPRDYPPSQLRRERYMAATLYEDALDVAGSDSAKRIGHRHAALLVPGQRYVHSERQRIDFNNRLPGLRFW